MDPQILVVLSVVAVVIALLVTEVIRIDVVALGAMLVLAAAGIISPEEARSGFASNAVLAVVAVMIMGRGLHVTGVTRRIARFIARIAGRGRRRVTSTVGLVVGSISGSMPGTSRSGCSPCCPSGWRFCCPASPTSGYSDRRCFPMEAPGSRRGRRSLHRRRGTASRPVDRRTRRR